MNPNKKHNKPPLIVEMNQEIADFIDKNCDSNISMAMNILVECQKGNFSEEAGREAVDLIEQFRAVKKVVQRARNEQE